MNNHPSNGKQSVLTPIRPQKVYIVAADQMVERIRQGFWQPGSRLPAERELSEMLSISRASVRQALMALESIGVLYSKRGVGHFVKEEAMAAASTYVVDSLVKEGDPQELLEARRILEPELARLAALYRESDDVLRLNELLERMEGEEQSADLEPYLEADFLFHLNIAYATHNPVLIDLEKVIIERMKAPPWKKATYTIGPKNFRNNLRDHSVILDAISGRKSKEAQQAMIQHIANVTRNVRNISHFLETE